MQLAAKLPCSVFHEDTLSLQLHEEFSSTQVLQYQVEFAPGLKCVNEVHYERMPDCFENTSFCLGVCCVLRIPYDSCLKEQERSV